MVLNLNPRMLLNLDRIMLFLKEVEVAPPIPTIADKGMTLGNNGVELETKNAIELEQDNAIAKRGRGRPQKNNSGRTGRPPAKADKVYSEYYKILEKFNYLTGETVRDTWLEKLLQVEKASHDAFSGDSQKYKKNMRQLHYSLQVS
ncbi:hypothetical protein MKW92_028979 [Papaver armeniacum]|nr:hypothetical protein MKW92_028979 [Papaver armeniacum]